MPSDPSFDEFMRKFLATGAAIRKGTDSSIEVAAKVTKARIERAAVAAAGSDKMFRNLGKAKAVLGVNIRVDRQGDEITASVEARGPWGLSESTYGPWVITPKMGKITGKGAKARRLQRKAAIESGARGTYSGLRPLGNEGAGFGPRYMVRHPVHKAKTNWSKAKDDVFGEVQKELVARQLKNVREVWDR